MDFEVASSPVVKVRIYGKDYDLTKPTYKMAKSLGKKVKGVTEETAMELMSEYLVGLGLPQDVLDGMELEHVLKLTEFLTGKKN